MTTSAREALGEERRAAIVASALDVFAERGYKGASLAVIAERVGLTQQGILYHFGSKQRLLIAALEERDRQGEEWWVTTFESAAGRPDFLDMAERLVEHMVGSPEEARLFIVLAGDSVTVGHPAHEFFRRRYATVRARMAETFDAATRCGGPPLPSPAVFVAVLDGLQLQWLLEPESFDLVDEFRSFVELLRS
jgi:AcrR family transcriptional regulator